MTAVVELADHGLLSALAIAYDKAGFQARPARIAHISAHLGRWISSTSELTAAEARQLRRHLPHCPDHCTVMSAPPPATARAAAHTCACAEGGRPGQPSACDPGGSGRWCPPRLCWCGSCPWWTPAPPVNYAGAIERLAEQAGRAR